MAIRLTPEIVARLGYRRLTLEEARRLLDEIYDTGEAIVGSTIANRLNRQQLDEFETLMMIRVPSHGWNATSPSTRTWSTRSSMTCLRDSDRLQVNQGSGNQLRISQVESGLLNDMVHDKSCKSSRGQPSG